MDSGQISTRGEGNHTYNSMSSHKIILPRAEVTFAKTDITTSATDLP